MKIPRAPRPGHSASGEAGKTREQLAALAWLLDSSIRLPGGFRIGIDALIGLVPFLGDAAGVLLSGYIVSQAARLGVPRSVLLRMMLNVGVEGLVGLIPLVGDLFDAGWKANQRNVQLLGKHLDNPAETARSSRRVVGLVLVALVLFMVLLASLSALVMSWIWHVVGS
jgi:hypothetical protein